MPKLEPKQIQKELEAGKLWPVYWLYGQERMKSRELLRRIRKTVLGEETSNGGLSSFNEDVLDGGETSVGNVIDAVQSLSLGGGTRLVIVRDAHALKGAEDLAPLLGEGRALPQTELTSVCVFLSKDLDARKKFSKLLLDKAAVVPCEEVSEEEREAWIGYLAKRRGLQLSADLVILLRSQDPWTLDIVDQELTKFELAKTEDVIVGGTGNDAGSDAFLQYFLNRRLGPSLEICPRIAESPEEALPLLGLLAWNVRYLALLAADREHGTRTVKVGSFVADRLNSWLRNWRLDEVLELQRVLQELDFAVKQTPRLPLGLWTDLVARFCRP